VSSTTVGNYRTLRRLAERGRELERQRGGDPFPPPSGDAPGLEELRRRQVELERLAARHGASGLRVFGSVARGEQRDGSDLDLLVELEQRRGLLAQAALKRELEQLLGCPVHIMVASALAHASPGARGRIRAEALAL
jgi:uncharacterized protein